MYFNQFIPLCFLLVNCVSQTLLLSFYQSTDFPIFYIDQPVFPYFLHIQLILWIACQVNFCRCFVIELCFSNFSKLVSNNLHIDLTKISKILLIFLNCLSITTIFIDVCFHLTVFLKLFSWFSDRLSTKISLVFLCHSTEFLELL